MSVPNFFVCFFFNHYRHLILIVVGHHSKIEALTEVAPPGDEWWFFQALFWQVVMEQLCLKMKALTDSQSLVFVGMLEHLAHCRNHFPCHYIDRKKKFFKNS